MEKQRKRFNSLLFLLLFSFLFLVSLLKSWSKSNPLEPEFVLFFQKSFSYLYFFLFCILLQQTMMHSKNIF